MAFLEQRLDARIEQGAQIGGGMHDAAQEVIGQLAHAQLAARVLAAAPAPAAEPAKKPTPPPPGKTLARAGAAPAPTKKKLTEEELRADFVRQRASGKFDDE